MSGASLPPLVVVAGPTAVGKTEVAVRLAELLGRAEVVSADSRQIYRGMDVGTAKPTPAERHVPHHLLDVRDPDQTYSAGRFARDGWAAIAAIRARGAIPLVTGGSGLYLEALLDGLTPLAEDATACVRARLAPQARQGGPLALLEQLRQHDPVAARGLVPADPRRIARALERALLGAGRTGVSWRTSRTPGGAGPVVYCGLTRDRQSLCERIDRRAARMVAGGLIEEVQALRARGFAEGCPGLATLGYAEIAAYLRTGGDRAAVIAAIQRRTRQFAKRQQTWFGRDRRIRWIDLDIHGTEAAAELIRAHLAAESRAVVCVALAC